MQSRRILNRPAIRVLAIAWLLAVFRADASPQLDRSDDFFDSSIVQTIHLEIAREDLDRLEGALPARITVPGTFKWNDQAFGPVGIRYKGNSSSPRDWPFKRSFLISFTEFKKDQRFLGLRRVALDNGIQFGGLFSERLITDILRAEGVKSSRCNHARLFINGKPAGVYVNVERIDQPFLSRHFSSDQGPLFKVDEGGPGGDLQFIGNDLAGYRKTFELHSGKDAPSYRALLQFIDFINQPSTSGPDLEHHLDMEAFLKTTAILLLAGAFDQYTGWNPHNYYLYQDPADQRWSYIPWDLDVGFAQEAFDQIPVLEGWHAAWPAPTPSRPLMEHVVSDPELLRRYREHAGAILEKWFHPDVLVPKLRDLHSRIQTDLQSDPHPLRRVTVPSDTRIEDVLTSMERFIHDRYVLARKQLADPGRRPGPTRSLRPESRSVSPSPGPHSPDAPSGLRVVQAGSDGVELQWTDNAEGEAGHVVQRCIGAGCTDFSNAIGQGGAHVATATDRQVQAGLTYRYRVYAVKPTPDGPRGTGVSNVISVTVPTNR